MNRGDGRSAAGGGEPRGGPGIGARVEVIATIEAEPRGSQGWLELRLVVGSVKTL